MDKFHLFAAALVVIISGVFAVARFLLKEVHEFWRFVQSLHWKRPRRNFEPEL
jgi:hypothetical protein